MINTCGFLEASKDESLGVIQEAIREKEKGNIKRVVVAGCLVQRHRAKMLEWAPGIDAMVGVFDRDKIVEAVVGTQAAVACRVDDRKRRRAEVLDRGERARGGQGPRHERDGTNRQRQGRQGNGVLRGRLGRLRLTPRHYAYSAHQRRGATRTVRSARSEYPGQDAEQAAGSDCRRGTRADQRRRIRVCC